MSEPAILLLASMVTFIAALGFLLIAMQFAHQTARSCTRSLELSAEYLTLAREFVEDVTEAVIRAKAGGRS